MLTLYHAMHSTCSQKARICLFEKGLEFESRLVDLAGKEQLAPEYLKLNPNGVVPTLVHDGDPVTDSSVICEYLDEQFPQLPLSPPDALGRARMRAWLRFIDEVPTAAVRVPSFNGAFLYRFKGLDAERFKQEQADVRPLRKHFYRRMGPDGFSQADIEASVEQIARTVERMEHALDKGPWLLGERYTIADITVAPLIDRIADLGFSDIWSDGRRPRVSDWYRRMRERPAFQRAFPKGARLSDFLKVVPRAGYTGVMK